MEAYDVALLSACRDREWCCWSVAPELFHHARSVSEIWKVDVEGDFGAVVAETEGGDMEYWVRGEGEDETGC